MLSAERGIVIDTNVIKVHLIRSHISQDQKTNISCYYAAELKTGFLLVNLDISEVVNTR